MCMSAVFELMDRLLFYSLPLFGCDAADKKPMPALGGFYRFPARQVRAELPESSTIVPRRAGGQAVDLRAGKAREIEVSNKSAS